MAQFQFRLESVLKIRERERDNRRLELLQAISAEEILLEQAKLLDARQKRLQEDLRAATRAGLLDVDQVLAYRRYELILAAQQDELVRQLKAIREEIERRRAALLEANRALRVLELLRDKQRERFRKNAVKNELKQMDELANRQSSVEGDAWAEC
ncbi:MAG: flagellar export protein FliJ [Thermogutta sp.]|uniref:flagellar export protein FliJ n=1 Tax=Thermogutta sp. TaxID=1962930 RepID=UPI0019A52EF4|nr:flagellar export protein FliJ [Thermogutta sp.]MBC7351107.1 flagellar export protein FliJ [Thermogutta sp.]